MKDFLEWMATGQIGNSELVKNLEEAVQRARDHEEWRMEYMTLLMRDKQMREEGRTEGRLESLYELVQDNLLPADKAAERANMPLSEFLEALKCAGYNISDNK